MTRPRLRGDVRLLRRGPDSVQLGPSPTEGVVLTGLLPREQALVHGLDGSMTRNQVIRRWQEHRVSLPRATEILDALASAGALDTGDDGDRSRSRSAACVLVTGVGELPAVLVSLLRSARVGHVFGGRYAVVDGLPPSHPDARVPDLEVLVGRCQPGAPDDAPRSGAPALLPVGVSGARVLVGPLVRPQDGPCLGCLALRRGDLDPAWPQVAGALAALDADTEVTMAPELVHAAAGLVAISVLAWVDGRPPPAGVSYELSPPWPAVRQRRWLAHPRCRCARETHLPVTGSTLGG